MAGKGAIVQPTAKESHRTESSREKEKEKWISNTTVIRVGVKRPIESRPKRACASLIKKKRAEHVSVSDMQPLSRAGEIPNPKQSPIEPQ